jgi:cation transporter-like permease
MSLISLVISLIVVGVLLWLVNTYIPMDGKIKKILNIVVVVCVVLWLLSVFGVLGHWGAARVPQLG